MISIHIHEVKVAAIEALDWIGGPLSAKELWVILDPGRYAYPTVAYHVKNLCDLELIELTDSVPRRGSAEKFYVLKAA